MNKELLQISAKEIERLLSIHKFKFSNQEFLSKYKNKSDTAIKSAFFIDDHLVDG